MPRPRPEHAPKPEVHVISEATARKAIEAITYMRRNIEIAASLGVMDSDSHAIDLLNAKADLTHFLASIGGLERPPGMTERPDGPNRATRRAARGASPARAAAGTKRTTLAKDES